MMTTATLFDRLLEVLPLVVVVVFVVVVVVILVVIVTSGVGFPSPRCLCEVLADLITNFGRFWSMQFGGPVGGSFSFVAEDDNLKNAVCSAILNSTDSVTASSTFIQGADLESRLY